MSKPIKHNLRTIIVVSAILLTLGTSAFFWHRAEVWVERVISDEQTWYDPMYYEVTRLEVRMAYELAFFKSALTMIWIFGSVGLVIKIMLNNKGGREN